MLRIFLAAWLALFAVQTTDLLAIVAPDGCVEDAGRLGDNCQETCAYCVCCARVPVFVTEVASPVPTGQVAAAEPSLSFIRPASPDPRGIIHVPKAHLSLL